jgi:hypothetical protein
MDGCTKVKYYDSNSEDEELLMNLEANGWNKPWCVLTLQE